MYYEHNLKKLIYYIKWNRKHSMHVSLKTTIASTAQIQIDSDGYSLGGEVEIGDHVTLSDGVIIAPYGGKISLAEGVFVGPYSVLYGHGSLTIGRNTLIAGHCLVIPSNHGFDRVDVPIKLQQATSVGICIGDDVWIGAGTKVLDGVTIGNGCVIGAGTVVNRSLPDYAVVVGIPARIIRYRNACESTLTSP